MKTIKNFLKVLAVVVVVITSTAVDCAPWDSAQEVFTIKNNTTEIIYYYIPEKGYGLPDEKPYMRAIDAKSSAKVMNYEISSRYLPDDRLPIYILTATTINKYTWDTIASDHLFDDLIRISVPEVLALDKTVQYPFTKE